MRAREQASGLYCGFLSSATEIDGNVGMRMNHQMIVAEYDVGRLIRSHVFFMFISHPKDDKKGYATWQ